MDGAARVAAVRVKLDVRSYLTLQTFFQQNVTGSMLGRVRVSTGYRTARKNCGTLRSRLVETMSRACASIIARLRTLGSVWFCMVFLAGRFAVRQSGYGYDGTSGLKLTILIRTTGTTF